MSVQVTDYVEKAYRALGDGVMWFDGEYFMRCGGTQDIVFVPHYIAIQLIPRLCQYTRFGQDRWWRPDAMWANAEPLNHKDPS